MNKKILIIFFMIFTVIGIGFTYILSIDKVSISYKIHNDYREETYDYTKRGYYTDTLYEPNAPFYYIITMGEQNTGGYSISINSVKIDKENNVEVIVEETKPTGIVTMALTCPACCLELSSSPNSILIKNTEGEIFQEIIESDSKTNKNTINNDIIGTWYPNDITANGEEGGRSLTSYFGDNVNEKNHFEFFENQTYIKIIGELDEKGTYKIVNDKIYMTSNSGKTTIAKININENNTESLILIEEDNDLIISYLKCK